MNQYTTEAQKDGCQLAEWDHRCLRLGLQRQNADLLRLLNDSPQAAIAYHLRRSELASCLPPARRWEGSGTRAA